MKPADRYEPPWPEAARETWQLPKYTESPVSGMPVESRKAFRTSIDRIKTTTNIAGLTSDKTGSSFLLTQALFRWEPLTIVVTYPDLAQ